MMKLLRFLLVIIAIVTITKVSAQSVHNYFSADVYPGIYAQVTFGQNYILLNLASNGNLRLNYSHKKNNIVYYSYNDFVVAMAANGSSFSTIVNGQVNRFTYVGQAVSSDEYSNSYNYGSGSNSDNSSRRTKCHFCNGTGKVTENKHIPQYSTNDYYEYKTCPECGYKYNSTLTNHYHSTCSHCYGRGYIER